LRLADDFADFFGLSSALGMRSAAVRRRSASAAGKPNSGSFRPPGFFFPHAIRKSPGQPAPPHASGGCLRPGYPELNARLGGAAFVCRSSAGQAAELGSPAQKKRQHARERRWAISIRPRRFLRSSGRTTARARSTCSIWCDYETGGLSGRPQSDGCGGLCGLWSRERPGVRSSRRSHRLAG
jgi:hypothetical protein